MRRSSSGSIGAAGSRSSRITRLHYRHRGGEFPTFGQQPLQLNVSVLNASTKDQNAQRLAILLDRQQRQKLEEQVGMRLEVTNISSVREGMVLPRTKIYFRPNFMKAALALSEVIPGEQLVEQMPSSHKGRMGTDVEVYVGENFE